VRCANPGHCSFHDGVVSPICLRHVRGEPPSHYIPRPYLRDVNRSPPSSPTATDAHDALVFLLANVRKIFDSYEASLTELESWRRYFNSGN